MPLVQSRLSMDDEQEYLGGSFEFINGRVAEVTPPASKGVTRLNPKPSALNPQPQGPLQLDSSLLLQSMPSLACLISTNTKILRAAAQLCSKRGPIL